MQWTLELGVEGEGRGGGGVCRKGWRGGGGVHDRSQTLKSDKAKTSKLIRIIPVGSLSGGNTHDFEARCLPQ